MKFAFFGIVHDAGLSKQLALVRAHPELAGKAMVAKSLTAESTHEQQKAGLTDCTPEEMAHIAKLNGAYLDKFGFPFVLAVRGPRGTGLHRREIIATVERRLANHPDFELAENLRNIHRIAEIRLNDKFGITPELGNLVWDWAERLAQHSDPGYAENGQLTVTYLTDAHRACAQRIAHWMRDDCGFDDVSIDAVGNVVGIYHGTDRSDKRCSPAATTTRCATAASTTGGSASSRRWPACANCTAPAGDCRSTSKSSPLPKRKASATRRPSSARARSSGSSIPPGSTRPMPTASRCAARWNMRACASPTSRS